MITETEKQSALWQKIEKHYKERLDKLRTQNDKDQDGIQTAHLRGRISEVKSLLALTERAIKFVTE